MSVLGHERLFGPLKTTSALPFRTELGSSFALGRFVPTADMRLHTSTASVCQKRSQSLPSLASAHWASRP